MSLMIFGIASAAAESSRIGLLYPLVSKPYSTVFEQIISGVSQHKGATLSTYGISDELDTEELKAWYASENFDALVILGRRGIEGWQMLDTDIPAVVGGILYTSEEELKGNPAISLTPSTGLLFQKLRELSPDTKRIYVVYSPSRYAWLMRNARQSATRLGLTLVARPAEDLRESAKIHRDILREATPATDAIWLLQDPETVGESTILPFVLKEAWSNKLIVFSSNPSHVPRGALFSLYADNVRLGEEIAELAIRQIGRSAPVENGIMPMTSTQVAVNMRTAGHVGLRIPFEAVREFGLVFPNR